ncbi:NRDE family protein [Maribacter sp. 2304DJ31-5]|uniref:NRDE family protein n=1 Tax=Maribacter sp. 2304DJ31-5 TaxID=3386273 RepID=UPI0039BCD53C
MCTVSFIPKKDTVFITSNRDEHISRQANLIPTQESINGQKILYPKDKTGGGTWFSINENGTALVLLNGAFKNHQRTLPYRKSRGLIVLEVISKDEPIRHLKELNLEKIEPFTLMVFDNVDLYEFRWDGTQKHLEQKDSSIAHLWSSWTLYNETAQKKRNVFFKDFISGNKIATKDDILAFHKNNHGDYENGFIVDRKNGLKTLSITQAIIQKQEIALNHYDLLAQQKESVVMPLSSFQNIL